MIVVLEIHHQLSSSWRLHEVKVPFSTVVELVFTPIGVHSNFTHGTSVSRTRNIFFIPVCSAPSLQ